METLFLCLWEPVHRGGRDYEFTISENESTILLFWACGDSSTDVTYRIIRHGKRRINKGFRDAVHLSAISWNPFSDALTIVLTQKKCGCDYSAIFYIRCNKRTTFWGVCDYRIIVKIVGGLKGGQHLRREKVLMEYALMWGYNDNTGVIRHITQLKKHNTIVQAKPWTGY